MAAGEARLHIDVVVLGDGALSGVVFARAEPWQALWCSSVPSASRALVRCWGGRRGLT